MATRPEPADGAAAGPSTAWSCLALVLAPLAQVHIALGVAAVVAGVVAVVLARRGRRPVRTQRLAAFALGLAVVVTVQVPFSVWIVVAALVGAGRRWTWLRPVSGWLPAGEADRATWIAGAAVVVVAGVTLTAWARWTATFGEGTMLLVELVRGAPLAVLVPLAVLFVVVNAVVEEVAYRRLVQDALAVAWGPTVAVVVQAVAFGVLHVAGFPAGTVGMALAFVYGLVLGALRLWSDGLRAPIMVHIGADATIAVLVWLLVVPDVA